MNDAHFAGREFHAAAHEVAKVVTRRNEEIDLGGAFRKYLQGLSL